MKKAKDTTNKGRGDNDGRGSIRLTSLFSNVKGDISEHLREKERTNLSENLKLVLDSLSMLFYNAIDVICIRFTLIERPFMLLRNNFIYQLVNSLIKDVKSDDTVENNTSLQLLVDLACELNPSLREVKINNLKELLKAKAIQQQLLNSLLPVPMSRNIMFELRLLICHRGGFCFPVTMSSRLEADGMFRFF